MKPPTYEHIPAAECSATVVTGLFCGLLIAVAGSLNGRRTREASRVVHVCAALLVTCFSGGVDVVQHFMIRARLTYQRHLPWKCARTGRLESAKKGGGNKERELLAVLTAIALGLVPAWPASRFNLLAPLEQQGR